MSLTAALLQHQDLRAMLLDHLQDPPAAAGHAGQGVFGDNDRQAGFLHQ